MWFLSPHSCLIQVLSPLWGLSGFRGLFALEIQLGEQHVRVHFLTQIHIFGNRMQEHRKEFLWIIT